MDRVTIMLQNKQLIEELINSSEQTSVKVHAAIIDGVSKRIVKNVINSTDDAIKSALREADKELSKNYISKEPWGGYKLREEYQKEIVKQVRNAWVNCLNENIQEVTKNVAEKYQSRLEFAINEFLAKINRQTDAIDDVIKKAVERVVSEKLSK